MTGESLNFLTPEYEARKEELHSALVKAVENAYAKFGAGELDERVRGALLKVRRHAHIPLEYYAQLFGSSEALGLAYSNKILPLDRHETRALIVSRLAAQGADAVSLPEAELTDALKVLEPFFVSTASEPALVALMTQFVLPERDTYREGKFFRALDIGSGLGYQSAILAASGFSQVYGVEIKPYLAERAQVIAQSEGYTGIKFLLGDGRDGYLEWAPYDAIVVGAAVGEPKVVQTLLGQLGLGGKLILPWTTGLLGVMDFSLGEVHVSLPKTFQELLMYERISESDTRPKVVYRHVIFTDLRKVW